MPLRTRANHPRPVPAGAAFDAIFGVPELPMLTAMILICSLATTPDVRDCNRNNAIDVMWVPETFGNPITCYMHGQAYVAGTSLGRELSAKEHVKIVCIHQRASRESGTELARSTSPAR